MSTPTIIRTPRTGERPYFTAARIAAQDKDLSWEARGILFYLLSKPDDWVVQPTDLITESCKRGKVYRILKELTEAGYLNREQRFTRQHRFKGWEYQVYEVPHRSKTPCAEIRHTEIRYTEKQHLTDNREDTDQRKEQNKESTPLPPSAAFIKLPPPKKLKPPVLDPKQDLIFEWVVTDVLKAALQDVKNDKDLQGRANKLAAKIVNAAKTRLDLSAKQSLPVEERARIASRLPGLIVFYQTKKPNMEFPTGSGTFATLISQWFEAGCPGKQPTGTKPVLNYDPNCPHRTDPNPCDSGFIYFKDERGIPAPVPCECQLRILAERKGHKFP